MLDPYSVFIGFCLGAFVVGALLTWVLANGRGLTSLQALFIKKATGRAYTHIRKRIPAKYREGADYLVKIVMESIDELKGISDEVEEEIDKIHFVSDEDTKKTSCGKKWKLDEDKITGDSREVTCVECNDILEKEFKMSTECSGGLGLCKKADLETGDCTVEECIKVSPRKTVKKKTMKIKVKVPKKLQ